jgi:phage/plasmid primase-like uncharacterized protein
MPSTFDFGGGVATTSSQTVTIASGVATVAKLTPVILLAGEGSNADTLSTLTVANIKAGDETCLACAADETITVDDANIDLGAGTRDVAGGGSLGLRYDGTSWVETYFLTAADNA